MLAKNVVFIVYTEYIRKVEFCLNKRVITTEPHLNFLIQLCRVLFIVITNME